MNPEHHFYEPKDGHGLPHSPFNAIIAPRPIGWISSQGTDGVLNLAPFSFFNAFNYTPPIIGFASNGPKDTLANAQTSGEFCWNLATAELAEAMNTSSAAVPAEVDEFSLARVTPAVSRIVNVPHVAEARAVFECRTTQVIPLLTASGAETETRVVFGEVVGVHMDNALLQGGIYQTKAASPILRGGGPSTYFTVTAENESTMDRPLPP